MRIHIPMTRWMWLAGWLLCGAGLAVALHAEEESPSTNSRSTHSPAVPSNPSKPSGASAERSSGGPVTLQTLEARLNEILEHQQTILDRLDEVKAELQIVKVRATVR